MKKKPGAKNLVALSLQVVGSKADTRSQPDKDN
jgi:hypothetical protein